MCSVFPKLILESVFPKLILESVVPNFKSNHLKRDDKLNFSLNGSHLWAFDSRFIL